MFDQPLTPYAAMILVPQASGWSSGLFTYSLPADIASSITVGQTVLVPFGPRLTLGIVWSLIEQPIDAEQTKIRPVHEILDPVPLIDAAHRALAEWLASAYVCSLADAVRLILPGMTSAPRIDLVVAPENLDSPPLAAVGDDPETLALLGLLRQRGTVEEGVVRRALGPKRAGALIATLEERGALARSIHVSTDRATNNEPILTLNPDAAAVATWRDHMLAKLTGPVPASIIPLRGPRPAPVHSRTGRGQGAFLRAIAGSSTSSPMLAPVSVSISPREAVRCRAALAIVDLLQSSSDLVRTRREALRFTRATLAALTLAVDAGIVTVRAPRTQHPDATLVAAPPLTLNPPQRAALDLIIAAMDAAIDASLLPQGVPIPDDLERACRPILLHGVTGSGKTEVYLQALASAIECGRRGIVLVPEIALTPQTVSRFAARFPGRVALLHSALRPTERLREWERIRAGMVDVVIGSRSAIFAPIPDLGLIILDEEHDASYKHDQRPPTYHAREVAFALARLMGAAVVLGSATPSTETYYRATQGEFILAELPTRATSNDEQGYPQETSDTDTPTDDRQTDTHHGLSRDAEGVTSALFDDAALPDASVPAVDLPAVRVASSSSLPPVTIVDLRAELHDGHTSILSRELLAAIETTLASGEQAILYLNRRGTATCVICRDCGYVARCGRCDVPLTHHQSEDALICHYCNWRETPPKICLQCGNSGIRFFGVGTERVEATARELFPHARILRWDADTVHAYTDHERFGRALAQRQVDILIGTQMIAKGLDVPTVTLVGIVAADVALYLPDYRANERTFQLLTQVAGRAGRGATPGRVILQTFSPDHFCIDAAAEHDYHRFYDIEIVARQSYGYPPFRRFVKLTYTHKDRHACQVEALSLGDHLARLIADLHLPDTDIVGPAPAFIERLRNQYRWQMIVRGADPRAVIAALGPGELGPGWSIDIDPLSSL